MAVGVFDSGLGGLTVLDAVSKRLPDVPFVYFADSAHAPYGVRDADDIYELTTAAVERLWDAGCDLVILACNTASAAALRRMQENWIPPGKRVLGVDTGVSGYELVASFLLNEVVLGAAPAIVDAAASGMPMAETEHQRAYDRMVTRRREYATMWE